MLTYATLFSGVGGWDMGLEAAGLGRPLWMCEIGTFQRKVLAKRYPGVPVYEDIARLHATGACGLLAVERPEQLGDGHGDAGDSAPRRSGECPDCIIERPDILVASPPCQDLSVAGKRAGLSGVRSGLFFDFVRLVRELQPTWLCMEQVPGLLSSNGGADFGIAIGALADAGYFVEWRVLDARWFGVPQRRRRVFVVGHLGGPPARSVLFESEGSSGDSPTRGEAGADVAGTLGGGAPGARGWRGDLDSSGAYIPVVGRALTGIVGKHHDDDTDTLVAHTVHGEHSTAMTGNGSAAVAFPTDVARSLDTTGGYATNQGGTVIEVAHTLRASGFDASEDGTGRGTPLVPTLLTMREGKDGGGKGPLISEDQSLTLATGNSQTLFAASVRRLTPTECEKLMSWPPGWTCLCGVDPYTTATCTCSDGPRYAACGNGVVASVAEWVGRRLIESVTP